MTLIDKVLGREDTRSLTMNEAHPHSWLDAGTQGVIGKPFDPVALPDRVVEYLEPSGSRGSRSAG